MKDFFALLGQLRRPWLDPEPVKEAFVAAASAVHPDRIHDAPELTRRHAHQRYTDLNEAHRCLVEPRCRLRHFLELERGHTIADLQELPDDLMDLFSTLNRQFKETDLLLKERALATSPLLKVSLFQQAESCRVSLQQTQSAIQARISELEISVRTLDHEWVQQRATNLQSKEELLLELEKLSRLISFHERWLHQLQARTMQLME